MWQIDRIGKTAGVVLLAFAALLVAGFALDGASSEGNPLARGDTEQILRDFHDNPGLRAAVNGVNIATDVVLLLGVAAVLFTLFRDRGGALATFGALSLVAGGVAFAATDAAGVTLSYLAADFLEEGGVAGVAAGDAVTLQLARAMAVFSLSTALVGLTAVGLGMLAFGSVIAAAPEGETNPPRWIGGAAVLGGVAAPFGWLALAHWETGMAILSLAILAVVVFSIVLGGWLLFRTAPGEAREPAGVPQSR